VVKFVERGRTFDEAVVAIYYDTCAYPSCCQGSMCDKIATTAPIAIPTPVSVPMPVPVPTQLPTTPAPPTSSPVAPTSGPTIRRLPPSRAPTFYPTPSPTKKKIYGNLDSNSFKKKPKKLLQENFRKDLGVFNGGGNMVEQNLYQYILTAKFEMKEYGRPPYITTDIDLKGTSVIQVSFWYNAEMMVRDEGFRLQYSTNHGNSWLDVLNFSFGETYFNELGKWNYANSATFEVTNGLSHAAIRFVGETQQNDGNSTFYIAGVNVYGIDQ